MAGLRTRARQQEPGILTIFVGAIPIILCKDSNIAAEAYAGKPLIFISFPRSVPVFKLKPGTCILFLPSKIGLIMS